MGASALTMSIPLHAARRQAEYLPHLLELALAELAVGRPADDFLARHYREHREFGGRDRRFFSGMIFAWHRWRGWLPESLSPTAGLAAVGMLDGLTPHPALDCLAEAAGLPPPQPLHSVSLAERAVCLKSYLQLAELPALAALAPPWIVARLYYPPAVQRAAHLQACLEAFQTRPALWVRHDCHAPGMPPAWPAEARRHSVLTQAVSLPAAIPPDFNPAHTRYLEVQDLASQAVGLICAPRAGERWWDACAGAGGKTLHLADLMAGTGEIWATDVRPNMLKALQRRRAKHAPATIHARPWRGAAAECPPGLFDGVLVDAPCSGVGTWGRNPDARWRLPESAIDKHAARQSELLAVAAEKVRPGGCLVYAVCTMTADETAGVTAEFARRRPDFKLCPMAHPLTGQANDGQIWIWPWEGDCNGMFVARWQRQS
jgi:16S rRNA (cytosine967-C5)-methyltransferase